MNKKASERITPEDSELNVEFIGSEDVPIVFANNVFVRYVEETFLITFAQAHGPYIINPTNEQLKQIGKIPSQVVARIALSPVKMKKFLDVLNSNYQKVMEVKVGKV